EVLPGSGRHQLSPFACSLTGNVGETEDFCLLLELIVKDRALPEHFLGLLEYRQGWSLPLAREAAAGGPTDAQAGIKNREVEQVRFNVLLQVGSGGDSGTRRQAFQDPMAVVPEFQAGTFDLAEISPRQKIHSVE